MCLSQAALDNIDDLANMKYFVPAENSVPRGEFAVCGREGGVAWAGVNNVKLFQRSACRSDPASDWSASPCPGL